MGVTIAGVRHEELADPGGGSYASQADYNAAAGGASQQGGQNLNWGGSSPSGSPSSSPSTPATPSNPNGPVGTNPAVDQMVLNNIQANALQVYYNAKLALDTDQEAYQKAAQAVATQIAQAGVTGTFNGQPTQQAIKQLADIAAQQATTMTNYAQQFGVWGVPQQGQQTLAAQQQGIQQAQNAAQLTGWYTPYTYTPPTGGAIPSAAAPSSPAAAAGTPSQAGPLTQDSYLQARTAQLQQVAGMGAQQAQQTAQAEWAQGNAQSGNVAYGMPSTLSTPSAVPSAAATPGAWTSDSYVQARTQQLMSQASMGQAQATQTAQAEWAQGYAQSGNVAYGMPSTGAPATAATAPAATDTGAAGQSAVGQAAAPVVGAPPGYVAGQPIQTLAGQQQAYSQWLQAQQQAEKQWQDQQTASQNYLQMLSTLRGPADWAQYQKVLGATPGGTQDLVRAAAGQYIPGGGATTGVQPQAADLNSLYNQATGADTSGQSSLTAMQNSLVAPNQMAPQTWNALAPSQQQMLLGVWESQGYSKDDAQALFNQSLPKYAGASSSGGQSGAFRLQ